MKNDDELVEHAVLAAVKPQPSRPRPGMPEPELPCMPPGAVN